MPRTRVSPEELLTWMNNRIQEHEGCETVRLLSASKLGELDPEGNNWSTSHARISGVPRDIYEPVLYEVVGEAKRLFDLV